MSLETGSRIDDLVATNPVGATDFVSQGDDHIRLIKACVKGSFPSLGATAVAVTAEKLNFTNGLTSDAQTQLDGKQPLDADLTSIAALTTAPFGRSLLTLADAAALRTAADVATFFQPIDSDLTSIAALTTTSYGRGFLTLADNAALVTKIAAIVPTWTGAHEFQSTVTLNGNNGAIAQNTTSARWWRITTTGGDAFFATEASVAGNTFTGSDAYAAIFGSMANRSAQIVTNGIVRLTVGAAGGIKAPKIESSTSTTLVAGQIHHIAGTATIPTLGDGEWVCIVNTSGAGITINKKASSTSYWTGAGSTIANSVTLGARGRLFVSGDGSSYFFSGDITGSA